MIPHLAAIQAMREGWERLQFDMTQFVGQDVQGYVGLSSRNQPVDDSRVYVDDVSIQPGTLNKVFLPVVTRCDGGG
jgi:hypothetical protein